MIESTGTSGCGGGGDYGVVVVIVIYHRILIPELLAILEHHLMRVESADSGDSSDDFHQYHYL